jgi:hypothetical protein
MSARSGPKSVYKPDEEQWLQSAFDVYMKLVLEKPADHDAQRKLKDKKVEEFLTKFESQLIDENRKVEPSAVTEIGKWRTVSILHNLP